jgi:hypothetical protein
MSELAINQYGESFAPPPDTAHWLVRRMNDNKHGGPMQTFGANGRPITLPAGASLADFRQLRSIDYRHGTAWPLDAQGRPLKAPVAYLPAPPERSAPSPEIVEAPRNGNLPPTTAPTWAGPAPVAPVAWSTGGAFPLPAPASLLGAEYLLGEALRAQTAMLAIVAQTNAQISAQQSSLLSAAAELVRAADGAKLPARKPSALPPAPQVIVQPVPTPTYEEFEDGDDDEAAPPPAWRRRSARWWTSCPVSEDGHRPKMADMMGAAPRSPRRSTSRPPARSGTLVTAPADFVELSPESAVEQIDFCAGSLVAPGDDRPEARPVMEGAHRRPARSHGCLRAARLRVLPGLAQAARRVRPRRRCRLGRRAAPGTGRRGRVARSTAMPASGPAVQATIRDMVEGAMGGGGTDAGVVDDAGDTAPPQGPPGTSPLAGLYDTLANEGSVISPVLRRIPGGGATVEAAAETLLGSEAVSELNAAIDSVPEPPMAAMLRPASPATAPGAASVSDPNVMMRLADVLAQLTPAEQATARRIASRLPLPERNALLGRLMAVPLPDAVDIVRDSIAKYDAHGRPFG